MILRRLLKVISRLFSPKRTHIILESEQMAEPDENEENVDGPGKRNYFTKFKLI
jgi:hypothetical protein